MADARFNPNHAAAGSATGGQFAASSGSGDKKAPDKKAKQAGGHDAKHPPRTRRERLLAELHATRQKIHQLAEQLQQLEHEHHIAAESAKADAKAAKAAHQGGHSVHHHKQNAPHAKKQPPHAKPGGGKGGGGGSGGGGGGKGGSGGHADHAAHAANLHAKITDLRKRIHGLRKKAAHLEMLASALRSAGIPGEQVRWMNEWMAARYGGATAHPAATEKLHEYWVHGEGAAKIRWGTPGDFQRCVDHLDKYMPGRAQGYCNLAHKAATGMYPAQHAKMEKHMAEPDGMLTRSVPFEVTRTDGGDGLTLEGYAAVFGRSAMIPDRGGEFEEQIAPGAFADSLARKTPVLMFEHGKHPLIGTMPLGRIETAREDGKGLFISARLSDNWLIQPVRDAVRDGAVDGMSFRFTSPGEGDQRWEKRDGQPDLRTLLRVSCAELGPVVFPAYEPTTASVRSLLDEFDDDFTGRDGERIAPGGDRTDALPGNGGTSPDHSAALLRDRIWRMRGNARNDY